MNGKSKKEGTQIMEHALKYVSIDWMESLQPVRLNPLDSFGYRVAQLMKFESEIEGIMAIGWFEHTSDWDPFLVVELTDSSTIEITAYTISDNKGNAPPEGIVSLIGEIEKNCSHIEIEDLKGKTHLININQIRTIRVEK